MKAPQWALIHFVLIRRWLWDTDTHRRSWGDWTSASQGERPQKIPIFIAPWSETYRCRIVRKHTPGVFYFHNSKDQLARLVLLLEKADILLMFISHVYNTHAHSQTHYEVVTGICSWVSEQMCSMEVIYGRQLLSLQDFLCSIFSLDPRVTHSLLQSKFEKLTHFFFQGGNLY